MNTFDETPHTDDFFISTEKALLDQRWLISNLLAQSWTDCWNHDRMADAIAHSLTFGVYQRRSSEGGAAPMEPRMVGFARVITDGCTYSMLCDVVIDPAFRGKGLAKFLVATITMHQQVKHTVSILRTKDAQRLYARFGFKEVSAMRRIPTS